ncbi:PilX N-terminal domain-containing pilus assembly protein [Desulfococcaceae bacterium HSG7]|nr:PilX N-terminal domain-containing pilus assembly protein [Desulfococcaceae bacterium HSG7]
MKLAQTINNEKGSALIISLMLLVLLTLLGMAATTTSTLEIMIADNERDYKVNFYKAESAAIQAAVVMENDPNPGTNMKGYSTTWGASGENWLRFINDSSTLPPPDMTDMNVWDDITGNPDAKESVYSDWDAKESTDPNGTTNVMEVMEIDGKDHIIAAYAAQFVGVKKGDSLKLTGTERKYSYTIWGHSNNGGGRALIELGYKREF